MVERARTVVCDSVALSLCCCFTGSSASRGGEQQGVAPPGGGQGLARGAGGGGVLGRLGWTCILVHLPHPLLETCPLVRTHR